MSKRRFYPPRSRCAWFSPVFLCSVSSQVQKRILKGNGFSKTWMRVQSALQVQISEFLVPSSEVLLLLLLPFNSCSELVFQTAKERRGGVIFRGQHILSSYPDLNQVNYLSPGDYRGSLGNCLRGGLKFVPIRGHEVNQSLCVGEKSCQLGPCTIPIV